MKQRLISVLWVCCSACVTCLAEEASSSAVKARLEAIANSYASAKAFMGSVIVMDGEQVLLDKGYGLADLEWDISNTPDVKFRLGSLTKQFTAALVLLLQQDGKLEIRNRVSQYLPNAPKIWGKITLAELLGHTSGIPDFTDDKDFPSWSMSPRTSIEEIAFFSSKPLEYPSGSKFSYSNSNYAVLGTIIEKVSGTKYSDLLRKRILEPLGMKDSGLDSDELVLPRRAQGYMSVNGVLKHARSESMTVPWAAGAMFSTTHDLLRWEQSLFNDRVLSESSLKTMTTPGKGKYGLGVVVNERNGLRVVEHDGGIEGFSAHLTYVPQRKIMIAVLSNVNSSAPDRMAVQFLDVMLRKPRVLSKN